MRERVYALDHRYEDRRDGENEFVRWLGIKNSGGMRPVLRDQTKASGAARLAYLVLVSREIGGSGYNPWSDYVDQRLGRIMYWGDAKAHTSKSRDDFQGNRYLAEIWRAINEHRWSDVPPILHFTKDTAGTARFNGVCVLAELRDEWFEENGARVRNYMATLDILPIDRVYVEWLRGRATGQETGGALSPSVWQVYAKTGEHSRLVMASRAVRDRREQLPPENGSDWKVLQQLCQLEPIAAERLIVRAFQHLPVAHRIEGTRATVDGGFDFHGEFQLPPPLGYRISLKGEVKRYAPDRNAVGPREVARLVSRLQRGDHGVFVTTSYFTRQCQQEVLEDRYPVDLISGDRLVGMLRQLDAVRDDSLREDWLEAM